jgi:hypothetical protein
VGVVRFVGYFNSSILAIGHAAGDELSPALRRSVPKVLRRMFAGSSVDELPVILADFGEESGLVAVAIVNPNSERLQRWRWESPRMARRASRDASCATFRLSGGRQPIELQFFVDAAAGIIGPQMRILLQLVADGAEAMLAGRNHAPGASTAANAMAE